MRIRLVAGLAVVLASFAAVVVACVGDDAVASRTGAPGDDGGGSSDGSSGTDASSDATTADTSSLEESGADAGPFSPATLGTDLALWLIAGKGVTEAAGVAEWVDQSPQPLTLVPRGAKPALEKGLVEGQDVITFSQKNMGMTVAHSPKLAFGANDDFVIAGVISENMNSTAFPGFVWFKAGVAQNTFGDGTMFGTSVDFSDNSGFRLDQDPADSLVSGGSTLADHAFHVVIGRRIGSTDIQLRTDGVLKNKVVNAFDVSVPTADLVIGSVAPPGATFNPSFTFRVAEVVAVHRTGGKPISDAEVATLEAYLKKKYKTP